MAKKRRSESKAASRDVPAAGQPITVTVECPVHESFRVAQVAGMFDVPLAEKSRETFAVSVPQLGEAIDGQPWTIGLIVGPSGSGKSTIARAAYGDALYVPGEWPTDQAVIDGFPECESIRDVTQLLTAVGFSTPPAWIRPYHVLSNGQRFRCDLARALVTAKPAADGLPLVVFDEFTSLVDRTVAATASVAVAKHVRRQPPDRPLRLVAVTCHYDVAEWLEADWILDMASGRLARGRLQRRSIPLEIVPVDRAAWRIFAPAHYLNASLSNDAQLFVGFVAGEPAACVAVTRFFGRTPRRLRSHAGMRRISRLVVLPDYQGVGIGGRLLNAVADHYAAQRFHVGITTGHPAMIALLRRSDRWRVTRFATNGHAADPRAARLKQSHKLTRSTGRAVVSAEFIG